VRPPKSQKGKCDANALQRTLLVHRELGALDHGEAILNYKGKPNFTAYSAGSHPSETVRPEALKQIHLARLPAEGLRSKSRQVGIATKSTTSRNPPAVSMVRTTTGQTGAQILPNSRTHR
jgi:hypothetical protein